MEDKQFENQGLNQNNDLFQDYIDSLPDEENGSETEEANRFAGISEQVEKDLLDYKRKGYGEHTVRSASSRAERRRRGRGVRAVPLIILGCAGAITLASVIVMGTIRNSYSYSEPPYEYTEEEYYDERDEEYAKMSGSLAQPEIFLNGHYVSLPLTMNEFMQEGWKVRTSAFTDTADTVGSEPVAFHIESEWGEEIAEVSVVSPTGEPVPVSEGLIIGLYTDNESFWYELNGGVYVGSSSWTVENALQEDGLEWIKRGNDEGSRYIIEAPADNEYGYDEYVLRLELEDDYVERITMQLSQGQE